MNFQFRSKPEQLSGDKLLATNEYGDIIIFKGKLHIPINTSSNIVYSFINKKWNKITNGAVFDGNFIPLLSCENLIVRDTDFFKYLVCDDDFILNYYRHMREKMCYPIINRGKLWYDHLTLAQHTELNDWYEEWLDVTETHIIPATPTWVNDKLNSRVRLRLLDIADDFIDELSVRWVKPEDIILTGSIANYNWSKYSDIDVHIIIDFSKIYKKKEFVEDYFNSKKELWKRDHEDLTIYGFPVELYVQDKDDELEASGVYSLDKNEWIKEPKNIDDAKINEVYVKEQAAKFMTLIDSYEKDLKKETDNHKKDMIGKNVKKLVDK